MKSQPEVEERLHETAQRIHVGPPPIEQIVHRGRRRLAVKTASTALVASVVIAALAWTGLRLSGFRQEIRLNNGTTIPKPRVIATIPLSGIPWGVAFDGRSVWVTSYFHDLVSQVDPNRNLEVHTIRAAGTPYELGAGRDAVWVAAYRKILRVDIRTGQASDVTDSTSFSRRSNASAIGESQGFVWIVDVKAQPVPQVIRFDPTTNSVVKIPIKDAAGLAFGAGSVWVSTCQISGGEAGVLYRIDPATSQISAKIQLPGALCLQALAAENGFIYATTASGGGPDQTWPDVRQLWKIDTSNNQIVGGPVRLSPNVGEMVSFRGVLWVLDQESTGGAITSLRLIDTTTLRTLFSIRVGQNVHRIAVGNGSLWIPAMRDGKAVLFRIAP
jgi:hypothetical protein